MVTVEDFSRLVSGIYAAAVTPQHWRMAVRDIHRQAELVRLLILLSP